MIPDFADLSESSRKPGAAKTMGVGGAADVSPAVADATEREQDAEGDTDRMAKALAKHITEAMNTQGWI